MRQNAGSALKNRLANVRLSAFLLRCSAENPADLNRLTRACTAEIAMGQQKSFYQRRKVWIAAAIVLLALEGFTRLFP